MKRYSKEGHRLYHIVKFKMFTPGNGSSKKEIVTAPAGSGFNEKAIEQLISQRADALERMFPGQEYRLVQLQENSFNFVWQGGAAAAPVPTLDEAISRVHGKFDL